MVDVEEPGDAARRRGVHDDRVVAVGAGAARHLVDLAGEQHVAHARGDGRGEVDDAELVERLPGPTEPVEHLQVLQQRSLGVDGQRVHGPAVQAVGDAALLVRQRRDVEELSDALTTLDLAQQHPSAAGGERGGQRGGHRGLAGASLAGHDVQRGPEGHTSRVSTRRGGASRTTVRRPTPDGGVSWPGAVWRTSRVRGVGCAAPRAARDLPTCASLPGGAVRWCCAGQEPDVERVRCASRSSTVVGRQRRSPCDAAPGPGASGRWSVATARSASSAQGAVAPGTPRRRRPRAGRRRQPPPPGTR